MFERSYFRYEKEFGVEVRFSFVLTDEIKAIV